jgi:hypothetical protein
MGLDGERTIRTIRIQQLPERPAVKYDIMGLLRGSAIEIKESDGARAYALLELANNLRLLMRGEDDMNEFKRCYTGHEGNPIDIDALMPEAT